MICTGGRTAFWNKCSGRTGWRSYYAADASPEAYARALGSLARPRLVWLETPTNPLLDIVDIRPVTEVAHAHDSLVVVDNTFATPYLQQPLKLGADLVVHSTTKYICGHSDVIGGAVIARTAAHLEPVRFLQNAMGAVPGPMDCYLVQRGLKTLAIRMEKHCANAQRVAEEMVSWKQIRQVIYPGLESHQGHDLARSQMRAFGGMVTIRLHGGELAARRFCSNLRLFACAESLGGVESLCSHPATMTHASIPRHRARVARNLRRHDPSERGHRRPRGPDRGPPPRAGRLTPMQAQREICRLFAPRTLLPMCACRSTLPLACCCS